MTKKQREKFLGIDFGLKRLGLALSDETHLIASPYKTLVVPKKMQQVVQLVLGEITHVENEQMCQIVQVVIGLPLKLSGKSSLMSDHVHEFIDVFQKASSIPILPFDERMTTGLAEKMLKDGGMNRKKRTKVVDTISASLVLQSYLDRRYMQNLGN